MKAKLIREETALSISGMAVMAFGLWTIIRVVMEILINMGPVIEASKGSDEFIVYIIVCVIMIFASLIALGLRAYIGLSARSFGRGKDKGILFIIVTGIVIFIDTAALVYSFFQSLDLAISDIAAIFVDLTSLFALVRVMVAAISVRAYRAAQ